MHAGKSVVGGVTSGTQVWNLTYKIWCQDVLLMGCSEGSVCIGLEPKNV